MTLRVVEGELMNELQTWLNTNIISTIRQLGEASQGASHGDDNGRILLNAIDGRKLKLTSVAHHGGEKLHRRTAANDRELRLGRRYEFCKKVCVCVGIYCQVA